MPHVLRLLIGPANKWLIPSALLGGCLLVTLSDIAARTVVPYADLPIGIFTAIVGGPTFFILLRRGMGGEKAWDDPCAGRDLLLRGAKDPRRDQPRRPSR
ncbi:heme ABC transporter [Cutibacterium acnes JCM 18916]|nr:heme ABC transporter [Cutibacterium acnes JCM 18916]